MMIRLTTAVVALAATGAALATGPHHGDHRQRAVHPDPLDGLVRRRWARGVLDVLATHGPQRYTDLLTLLSALGQGAVHSKSLSAALPYLREQKLITHHDDTYAITDLSAGLITRLKHLEEYLTHQHE